MPEPIALLLVPRKLDGFILRDQARDLLRSPGVIAVDAPWPPYGAVGRLPDPVARIVAAAQARRLERRGDPVAALIFHPFQWPLARALLGRRAGCELWYGLFDRTPAAPDADARTRARLEELHAAAADRSDLLFAVSPALVELEREAGREALLVPTAADSFPAPEPRNAVVAMSLGNLGMRTDWRLLRELSERMPDLTVLLVGDVDDDQVEGDADYLACLAARGIVWLGWRSDEDAARLLLCADVGIAPFRRDPFNEAGLPNRILKAARLGRRTITPDFPGVRAWSDAVIACADVEAWVAALRAQAGRHAGDPSLRDWALAQTAERQNAPLWARLRALGVAAPADRA